MAVPTVPFFLHKQTRPFWAAPAIRRRFRKAVPTEIYAIPQVSKQKSRPLRNGFLVWSCPADSNCRLSVACGNQQPLRSNTRFARRSAVLTAADRTNKKAVPYGTAFLFGAVEQIRTADLVITNDVLCLLSYNSKMATVNGLEPSTSSVTG